MNADLFFGCKIIFDMEELPNLLYILAVIFNATGENLGQDIKG
jgi:hypothetical protein